jgi:hypothetical protein
MLVRLSLNDSQVPYWEWATFAARLRAMKTDKHVLLLKTHMGPATAAPPAATTRCTTSLSITRLPWTNWQSGNSCG